MEIANISTDHIAYIAGGLLGDFFSQLSVIKEYYIKYNKKGLLYISDIKCSFRNPETIGKLETVYAQTYDIIKNQDYIYDYKLYKGERYNVDLSSWRGNSLLFKTNFYEIYKSEYNIDWGKHKWIDMPHDNKWKNTVLITTVTYRHKNYINYNQYMLKYPDFKFIFISIDKGDYDFFISDTKQTNIDYYCPENMFDTIVAINSCEFFMGTTSGLLCMAYSMHKKSITVDSPSSMDNLLHSNMHFLNTSYTY